MAPVKKVVIPPARSKSIGGASQKILALEPGDVEAFEVEHEEQRKAIRALAYYWGKVHKRSYATRLNTESGTIEVWRES